MNEREKPPRGVWYGAVATLILSHFAATAWTLDRHPLPYVDEPFFNYPAMRYLAGLGMNYRMASDAPHGDTVWAYHGVLFPWLQVATFKAFGASALTCRLPEYVAAHAALLVLGLFLVRRGKPLTAVAATVVWFGDRSAQEVLLGRMEGLALLALAAGFLAFQAALTRGRWWWPAVCTACLGFAAGFNPTAAVFVPAAATALVAASPPGRRARTAAAAVAGVLLPLAAVAWCVAPDFRAAAEQFRWHAGLVTRRPLHERLLSLFTVLRWSRYWSAALIAVGLVWSASELIRFFLKRDPASAPGEATALRLACAVFTVAGVGCLIGSTVLPYYLVYLSVWPIIGLFATLEDRPPGRRWGPGTVPLVAALAACWAPSLLWNVMRVREAVVEYPRLDPAGFASRLAGFAGARVTGTPQMIFLARGAGLRFEPLPWFGRDCVASPDAYILIDVGDEERSHRVAHSE